MRILTFLTFVSIAAADPVFLTNPDGTLYGPYEAPNAPADRKVALDPSKLPLTDRRGRPRWRKVGDRVELIPVAERSFEARELLEAWRKWADARAAYVATQTYVDARPALQAVVLSRIAELRAELDEMTRAGEAQDEP